MTTPDRAPEPVDLDAIRDRWLQLCAACDAGLSMSCTCPPGDPRNVIDALVREVERLRADVHRFEHSEALRVVELESELARARPVIEAAKAWVDAEWRRLHIATDDPEWRRAMDDRWSAQAAMVDAFTGGGE